MRETKVSVYTTNVYLALIVESAIISSKADSVDGFQGELKRTSGDTFYSTYAVHRNSLSVGVSVRQINATEVLVFVGDRYREERTQNTGNETLYTSGIDIAM